MKQVRAAIVVAIFSILNPGAFSQTWEIGVGGGVSYYVGDLNPTGHFKFPRPSATLFAKRILTNRWSLRAGFSYLGVYAEDAQGDWGYQRVRNLNFQSNIFELHVAAELNFFPFGMNESSHTEKIRKWTPYLVAGIGAYYYEPQASVNGNLVDLAPLGTEGQGTTGFPDRKPYSRFMPCVPFGMGVKFNINNKFTIAAEYSMRLTFNDYLDDVSQDYAFYNQIVADHGTLAGEASNQSIGDYSASSNDLYQRGIKTDLDWYGYLGVSLIFYIKDPYTCAGVSTGKGKSKMNSKTKGKGKRKK
jgi:hypothetical protein